MTRLSVVVPARDVAKFLPTTFAAVERTTLEDVEWIFVDDGSSDATGDALDAFRPTRGTAVVLHNTTPVGLSGARNQGLQRATGRAVAFLDADDWVTPDHYAHLTDAIERLGVDFVRCDHVRAEGRKRLLVRAPDARRGRALPARSGLDERPDRTSMVDYPYAWAGVYSARLRDRGLLAVDAALHTAEDRLLVWRLHLEADSFAVVNTAGYFYRRAVAGSLTAIGDERQLHFFDAMDRVGDLVERADAEPYRAKWIRTYLGLIAHHEERRERLQPAVHARFRDRARATLRALPADLVRPALDAMDPHRARLLGRLA